MKYFEPTDNRNPKWKEGDRIICICSMGLTHYLTEGNEYTVIRSYRDYNADEVQIYSDIGIINCFSSRFTTKKLDRKLKLKKLCQSV